MGLLRSRHDLDARRSASDVYASKMLAEGALFGASFALQHLVVFPGRGRGRGEGAAKTGRTDWSANYRRPSILSLESRGASPGALFVREAARAAPRKPFANIVELGGGNSLFLRAFRRRFPHAALTAIDTNGLGLRLLRAQFAGDPRLLTINAMCSLRSTSLSAPISCSAWASSSTSVPKRQPEPSREHFAHACPGGLVLITFPTPTWLDRLVRSSAERVGVWAFPDERPLQLDEVADTVRNDGEVFRVFVNWSIVLTQGVVIARKYVDSPAGSVPGLSLPECSIDRPTASATDVTRPTAAKRVACCGSITISWDERRSISPAMSLRRARERTPGRTALGHRCAVV